MNRRIYLASVASAVTLSAGCLGDETTDDGDGSITAWANGTLEFGLPPFQDAEELERQYSGLFEWLEAGFEDLAVTGVPTTDYSGVIESVVQGHTEMANLSPLIYVMAADEGITPLAVNELHGESSYHAYISTRTDTDIESLEELAGRTVAMVDPLSTSGGLFPLQLLTDAGLDVGDAHTEPTDLDIEWSFGHDNAVAALENGHVDAAAYGDFQHPDDDEIVKIAESDPIPLAAAVTAPETPDDITAALTDRLLETPESALEEHMVTGFGPYDSDDYDLVSEIATRFGVTVSDLDAAE